MNVGIQREIRHGMVFSADYLRNIETRTLLAIDINHVGGVANFNCGRCARLRSLTTNASFGCARAQPVCNCAIECGSWHW